jgi:hypothetical protein
MTALRAAAPGSVFAIQGCQAMCHPGQVPARAGPATGSGKPAMSRNGARQRIRFRKNLAIAGGLLIAAAGTAGRPLPGLARRPHRPRHDLTLGTRTARLSAKTGACMARPRGSPRSR